MGLKWFKQRNFRDAQLSHFWVARQRRLACPPYVATVFYSTTCLLSRLWWEQFSCIFCSIVMCERIVFIRLLSEAEMMLSLSDISGLVLLLGT